MNEEYIIHGPVKEVVEPKLSLADFYLEKLKLHADKVIFLQEVDGEDVTRTGRELSRHGKIVSLILREYGLRKDDTVMVCCGNTLDYAPVMLGSFFTGVALAPVNPAADTSDFTHLLNVMKPRLVFCDSLSDANMLEAVASGAVTPAVLTLAWLRGRFDTDTYDKQLASYLPTVIRPGDKEHVAIVMTSSGTTGRPKGVEIAEATLLYILNNGQAMPPGIVGMSISGPYWASGLYFQTSFISSGGKLILLRQFQEKLFLEAIQKHKVSLTSIGPDQVAALGKYPHTEEYDVSSLMGMFVGGAKVSPAMQELAERRLKKPITSGYAMTESLMVLQAPIGAVHKSGSVGTVFFNTTIKVEDVNTGLPVGPNQEGEICFKSPVVLKQYRGNPEATRALFDRDGYLHSGDIGYYDDDGYFYIVDRIKELIKYKLNHVPAVDIEEVLLQHVEVQDVAVVGIPNEVDTEHATGFVVRQPGAKVTEQQLEDLVKAKLPPLKWLYGGVHFIDVVPRTASGKMQKRTLRATHLARLASFGK